MSLCIRSENIRKHKPLRYFQGVYKETSVVNWDKKESLDDSFPVSIQDEDQGQKRTLRFNFLKNVLKAFRRFPWYFS